MTGGRSVCLSVFGLKIAEKFLRCAGEGEMIIVGEDQLPLWEIFLCVQHIDPVGPVRDTVIRNKCDSQTNAGQIDQKIIAGQFDFRNEVELVLLE